MLTKKEDIRMFFARLILLLAGFFVMFSVASLYFAGEEESRGACANCALVAYASSTKEKKVAITIDDAPNGEVTKTILEVLNRYDVPATFFVIGRSALKEPELVKRMVREGHVIGNHSYTHEENIQGEKDRFLSELNRTNQALATITGLSPILYRPPYLLDIEGFVRPPVPAQEDVWKWAHAAGYVPVGADIDTKDWSFSSGDEVIQKIESELIEIEQNGNSFNRHVMLIHGKSATAAALPEIIELLQRKGYEIVPLYELLGMTKNEVMPKAPIENGTLLFGFIRAMSIAWPFIIFVSTFIALLAVSRPFVFIAIKRMIREHEESGEERGLMTPDEHGVTVLVPAYNEGENMEATLESIFQNSWLPEEVLVLNDGSTDDTSALAHQFAARYPDIVRVFDLKNGGKAAALNIGIHEAHGDILISIDGDTVLSSTCIENAVKRFWDEKVGAVAGKVVPVTGKKFIEKLQYLEYITGQAMDKMAFSRVGSVGIVPGAVGAWRKKAILEAGEYSKETLVEDQDLSFALLSLGYKIVYEPKAKSYTEAPNSLRSFYKQRFRWTYGTYQCLWKYRRKYFSFKTPRIGWVVLPYSFFFNLGLPVLALFMQMFIILSLALHSYSFTLHFLVLYFLIDLVYAMLAFFEEEERDRKYLWLVPFQRVVYVLIYTVLVSWVLIKMIDGSRVGWGKLARVGSAKKFFETNSSRRPGFSELL